MQLEVRRPREYTGIAYSHIRIAVELCNFQTALAWKSQDSATIFWCDFAATWSNAYVFWRSMDLKSHQGGTKVMQGLLQSCTDMNSSHWKSSGPTYPATFQSQVAGQFASGGWCGVDGRYFPCTLSIKKVFFLITGGVVWWGSVTGRYLCCNEFLHRKEMLLING